MSLGCHFPSQYIFRSLATWSLKNLSLPAIKSPMWVMITLIKEGSSSRKMKSAGHYLGCSATGNDMLVRRCLGNHIKGSVAQPRHALLGLDDCPFYKSLPTVLKSCKQTAARYVCRKKQLGRHGESEH